MADQTSPKPVPVVVQFKTKAGRVDVITVDAAPSQATDLQVDITDHPIESGGNVSDHVRQKPTGLKLDVLAVDFPLEKSSGLTDGREGRALAIYSRFQQAQALAELAEISTPAGNFTDMAIVSIASTLTKENNKKALKFSVQFKKLVFVGAQTVKIEPKTRAGQSKKDLGKQPGKITAPPAKSGSLLYSKLID